MDAVAAKHMRSATKNNILRAKKAWRGAVQNEIEKSRTARTERDKLLTLTAYICQLCRRDEDTRNLEEIISSINKATPKFFAGLARSSVLAIAREMRASNDFITNLA